MHAGESNRATLTTAAIVIALHAVIIAVVLTASKRTEPLKVAAPHVVMATMINPTPVVVPVAQPTPPKPEVHKTPPKVVHRPTPKPLPAPTPKPTPFAAPDPTPTPPAPATPAKTAPPPMAPAPAPVVDPNIPKNVRHLTCASTPPDYPALSRRRGETGTVVIQFVVDTSGNVESARVKSSSGFDRLDAAAKAAALASPCTPYMEGGQAVKAITERPYVFSLAD